MNIEQEIRAQIEKNRDLKLEIGYINNHLSILEGLLRNERDDVQKQVNEAYQKGYDKGYADKTNNDEVGKELAKDVYQRGLDDAWEAARRISVIELNGGLTGKELMKIYGTMDIHKIYDDNTASEAIEKLKAYEEKQKAEDKIVVGDEVEVLKTGSKYLIAWISGTIICGFSYAGITCRLQPSDVRKTGRHFDIDKILEEMRND